MDNAAVALAIASFGVLASPAGATGPAGERHRAPLWAGADRMLLSCSADARSIATLGPQWCAVVLDEARRGARMPVLIADDAAATRDALALHVAASEDDLRVTIARAVPVDDAEGEFSRRAPALPQGMAGDPDVRAAIAAALDGALPWRRADRPAGSRSRRPTA